jgi:hypothetical protein
MEASMRRLTGLVVTGLCVCGSAAAQSGNPLVVPGPRTAGHPGGHLPDRAAEFADAPTISGRAADRVFGDERLAAPTTGLSAHDRTGTMLRNRLAAIARLRAAAVENGDAELLEQADRLEQQARLQLHTPGAADPSSRPSHRTAAYEYDPSTTPQVITPASGHPIGGFRHDSSAALSGDAAEFGLPASMDLGAGARDSGDSGAGEARFYSQRRNASELPRLHEPSDTWYGAPRRGLPDVQPVAADPRIEDREFGPPTPARTGVDGRGLGPAGESPFASGGHDRHPDTAAHRAESRFVLPGSTEDAPPFGGARPDSAAPPENPFATAFDQRVNSGGGAATETEFSPGRYEPRPANPVRSSAPVFESRTSSGTGAASGPFAQRPAAENRLRGHDAGLPAVSTPRRGGLVYGSELEPEFPGRRPGLPNSSDPMLYHGRDFGQATTAEARAAGRDFGLTPASATRSRIPVETAPGNPFGEPPGTSIGGALDTSADARRDAPAPARKAEDTRPEKRKRGLFSWFGRRGQSDK